MANLHFVVTADGSKTIFNPSVGENYHSKHGALQESKHVFVKSGLHFFLENNNQTEVSVLEVGFGTGLNFLLSAEYCFDKKAALNYTGIDTFPLSLEMIGSPEYGDYVSERLYNSFLQNYQESLKAEMMINEYCRLRVVNCKLEEFKSRKQFDVLYFDAFAAIHQPEMWTTQALEHCCKYLTPGGVFVTYAITGNLKRSMKSLGFDIEKAPGAPGKREMLRAIKK